MALFLSEEDVRQLLTMDMALAGVESAHRDLALGQAIDTPRQRSAPIRIEAPPPHDASAVAATG